MLAKTLARTLAPATVLAVAHIFAVVLANAFAFAAVLAEALGLAIHLAAFVVTEMALISICVSTESCRWLSLPAAPKVVSAVIQDVMTSRIPLKLSGTKAACYMRWSRGARRIGTAHLISSLINLPPACSACRTVHSQR